MKMNNYSRKALTLMTTFLLFLGICGPSHAMNSNGKSRQFAITASTSAKDDGRLIVRRTPNLGNNVIVDLYVDGVAVQSITYGRTYVGRLTPGRHVLSVAASPRPKWPTRSEVTLNVRKGETYNFVAVDDGSGQLVLKR